MKVIRNRKDYPALEQELCGFHLVAENDSNIDQEFANIQQMFVEEFCGLKKDEDYELPDWHDNIRMLWVYIYSDKFYDLNLIAKIERIVNAMENPWLAQFECYSPALESDSNQSGLIGWFLVYKESVVFSNSDQWGRIASRIGV